MRDAPNLTAGRVGSWAWFLFALGVAGVVFGLWSGTDFFQTVGAVLAFFWQWILAIIHGIPDIADGFNNTNSGMS